MHIENISISNFRRLKDNVTIDVDKETLIVGKNNTGKTSVSEIMRKCLTSTSNFKFEDFSSGLITPKLINEIYDSYIKEVANNEGKVLSKEQIARFESTIPSIILKILISIDEDDNLSKIKELLYEFDNNSKILIVLKYEFSSLKKCITSYQIYNSSIIEKNKKGTSIPGLTQLDFYNYLKRHFSDYFMLNAYTSKPSQNVEIPIDLSKVKGLFNIGVIAAQREVDDTSDQSSQTISGAIWNYYQKITRIDNVLDHEDEYKKSIQEIKNSLDGNYKVLFKDLIKQIKENIMVSEPTQNVEIASDFNIEEILKKNSKLKYSINDLILPESYNGLGYSNLMYMFIQIITYKHKVEKDNRLFNILFIEEPESHLHPQMQSTFLNKVQDILQCEYSINTILTTHSSYILQSAALDNIRYFLRSNNIVKIKSLKKFFDNTNYSQLKPFLKKFFRINTCDLFFTDKAILIEGSAERILMPMFKEKIDSLCDDKSNPISKQQITTLEVGGAYAHKFYELLNFLEIKTLIITDIDSVSGVHNASCKCDLANEGTSKDTYTIKTSNSIIKNWFNSTGEKLYIKALLSSYSLLTVEEKEKALIKSKGGQTVIRLAFQLPVNSKQYWGRTFEEQFILENAEYLTNEIIKDEDNKDPNSIPILESLKEAIKRAKICDDIKKITKEKMTESIYEIVCKIDKTNFAFDLLLLDSWCVPQYIREGLEWLKK